MNKVSIIGAPSLGGGAAKNLSEQFADAGYPLELEVKNLAHFQLSIPEADLFIKPLAVSVTKFKSFSVVQRAISSLSQIAELKKLSELASISFPEISSEVATGDGSGNAGNEGVDSTTVNTETVSSGNGASESSEVATGDGAVADAEAKSNKRTAKSKSA
ncbi:hypothetical protein [uncultured Tolumonas sp.]|uniref:hypothetical protein n=1 Tax=uncultured Tolumonas sp. TaxID=263765 RepID=UPI002A0A36EF|nr:hypothetical protein [uncultured Tolumonas sp.]